MPRWEDTIGETSGITADTEVARLAELGALIRSARQGRFTIEKLAERAGVSPGLLSQIERGIGNPSFRSLHRIASALDLRFGDFLTSDGGPTRKMVVRRHERKRIQMGADGLIHELLTPDLQGRLEMLATTVPPGFSNRTNPFTHVGEECVVVLSGHLEVAVGKHMYELEVGDAITYDASNEHWWANPTDEEASVIGAVTPPSF